MLLQRARVRPNIVEDEQLHGAGARKGEQLLGGGGIESHVRHLQSSAMEMAQDGAKVARHMGQGNLIADN